MGCSASCRGNQATRFSIDPEAPVLGSGQYGIVVTGQDLKNGNEVAVKKVYVGNNELVLEPSRGEWMREWAEKESAISIETERDILKRMEHPNIVSYVSSYYEDKKQQKPVLVMELCSGGTLSEYNLMNTDCEGSTVDEKVAAYLLKQLVSGVAYLHEQQIVHGDLKPENIFFANAVEGDKSVKIGDFGSAESFARGGWKNKSTALHNRGTPTYVSPQLIRRQVGAASASGAGYFTEKSDIWSLGIVACEILLGQKPFPDLQGNDRHLDLRGAQLLDVTEQAGKFAQETAKKKGLSDEAVGFMHDLLQVEEKDRPTARELLKHPFIATA